MQLARRITALLVLAFWLTATQHCGLEAAGLFASHGEGETPAGCCNSNPIGCADDGCETVENSLYRSDHGSVKVALPDFTSCLCLRHVILVPPSATAESLAPAGHRTDFSVDWLPTWQFERRAAAPAHAPDTLIA